MFNLEHVSFIVAAIGGFLIISNLAVAKKIPSSAVFFASAKTDLIDV